MQSDACRVQTTLRSQHAHRWHAAYGVVLHITKVNAEAITGVC